jgi:hypothetical protein
MVHGVTDRAGRHVWQRAFRVGLQGIWQIGVIALEPRPIVHVRLLPENVLGLAIQSLGCRTTVRIIPESGWSSKMRSAASALKGIMA